jgi:hypothetical protein
MKTVKVWPDWRDFLRPILTVFLILLLRLAAVLLYRAATADWTAWPSNPHNSYWEVLFTAFIVVSGVWTGYRRTLKEIVTELNNNQKVAVE